MAPRAQPSSSGDSAALDARDSLGPQDQGPCSESVHGPAVTACAAGTGAAVPSSGCAPVLDQASPVGSVERRPCPAGHEEEYSPRALPRPPGGRGKYLPAVGPVQLALRGPDQETLRAGDLHQLRGKVQRCAGDVVQLLEPLPPRRCAESIKLRSK